MSQWVRLDTTTGARLVSSRSGDGSQRAVDRSQTIGARGHAAEWDTPRSVGNGAPGNSLMAMSRCALPQSIGGDLHGDRIKTGVVGAIDINRGDRVGASENHRVSGAGVRRRKRHDNSRLGGGLVKAHLVIESGLRGEL